MRNLSILILGAGGMGRRHVDAFTQTEMCDVYCFDINATAIEKLKKKAALAGSFSELGSIPTRSFSGIVISTPTDTHLSYANWCLSQDTPFLIEKPLAAQESGLQELVAACTRKRLLSGVAFPRRSSIAVKVLKERLSRNDIGKLKLIRCNFSQDFRKYRPDYQSTYYAKLATGGGAIMDALSHHINLAAYFGGNVEQVSAFHDRLVFTGVEGDDCAFINLRFKSGILASLSGNQFQKPNEDFIELIGTDGNLRYERLSNRLAWNKSDSTDWQHEEIDEDWNEILQRQAAEFLEALAGEGDVKTPLAEGLHHLQVALAARRSQETGMTIKVTE